jgi:Na+/H+ antiporter NhaD/arsenite permease-like protein
MFIVAVVPQAHSVPPSFMLLPFVAMLLAIALMPFILKHHWEKYYHCWAVVLASISVGYYLFGLHDVERVFHTAHEYVSFIALIGSLFVVAGGIHIIVKGEAKPWVNVVYLLVASVVANLIGTTGASMLLIRPWIRMNKYRITQYHIVFFIFIVSNVAGCLTPIGDPPLFLGYLKGVPFWWVLEHCWEAWIVAIGILLTIFFTVDSVNYLRAPKEVREQVTANETWRFGGLRNLLFLAIILGSVFINNPPFLREALMIGAAVASYFTTKKDIHEANDFTLGPIKEVAWLFLGIFGTMMPALDYLQAHAATLGLNTEMQYYWGTGALSGVLDNAPTYLAFLASAFGLEGLNIDTDMSQFIGLHGHYLIAISMGAVFFGAMTYIGNGPNFMVKAIADRAKVETPSFFGYVIRY